MECLGNDRLRVEVLDPVADQARLGTRFCWGGYVWQVRDAAGRPLLAGPEWPHPDPEPFNGQGLPEVLRHSELLTHRPLTHDGRRGLVPGAGTAVWRDGKPELVEPARWAVTREAQALHFCTQQAHGPWGLEVQRTLELHGATLVSRTRVTNTAATPLPLQAFAHPFFPLGEGRLEVELPAAVTMAENPGYRLEGGRLSFRRVFVGRDDGHFQALEPGGIPLRAVLTHPFCGTVAFETDFVPDELYAWANGNTFSLEPYLKTELAPGAARAWRLSYSFGASAGTGSPSASGREPAAV